MTTAPDLGPGVAEDRRALLAHIERLEKRIAEADGHYEEAARKAKPHNDAAGRAYDTKCGLEWELRRASEQLAALVTLVSEPKTVSK